MDLVATHQRLLVGAALRTKGPILELGVGWYSTPLLHEIARAMGRPLWTVDNNMDWLGQFMGLADEELEQGFYHDLKLVGWWGELFDGTVSSAYRPFPDHFGLVFVDQGQPCEREYAVRGLIDRADVFVLHDTEESFAYGYDRLLGTSRRKAKGQGGLFEYQWTDKSQKAWTTVASNSVDVGGWFVTLPPVEPTTEVT